MTDEQTKNLEECCEQLDDQGFSYISSELNRMYTFPNGNTYTITNPQMLKVSKSGGHRILALSNGGNLVSHYVQPREGWAISWRVKDADAAFIL